MSSGGGESPQKRSGGGGGKVVGRFEIIDEAIHKDLVKDLNDDFHKKYTDSFSKNVVIIKPMTKYNPAEDGTVYASARVDFDHGNGLQGMSNKEYSEKMVQATFRANAMIKEFDDMRLRIRKK